MLTKFRLRLIGSAAAIALALSAASLPTTTAEAADVGSKIPHPLELVDQDGGMQNLGTLTPNKGVVLLFTRSLHW